MSTLAFILDWGLITMAAVFIYLSVACLIEVRKSRWRKVLLILGCWLLISMIIYIGDLANLPPTMFFFLLCVWIACKGSPLKRITIGLMIASAVFAFNGLHDNCILAFYYYHLKINNVGAGGRTLFTLLFYLTVRNHKPEQDFELSAPLWRLLLALSLPPLGIVLSLILFRSPYSSNMGTLISDSVLFIIAILSFVGLLWAVKVLERQQKLEREYALSEHNQKYYEAMEQQQFEIRRLKHDLSNHLQVLLALPAEEKDHYIEGMIDNPAFARVIAYSGDATVNAVLTAKESLMRERGIAFYVKVNIPKELPFEKADICAIFSNALDNAAEGCEHMEKEKRQVEFTAKTGKGLLAVCVKNPCEGKEEKKDTQLFRTTKKDSKNHGFGLRSIQEAVKRYNGNMEVSQANEMFTVFIYLPLDESGKV